MAKKMRKFLALVIAVALCAGQLAIPAMAETTVTGSGTPEDPQVTVTVTVESNGSTTTDSNSVWESVDVETGGSSSEGNPSVEVSTDITTTVKGSEDITQNIHHDNATGIETITGSLSGQETTTIDGTTVTTTTTTGELIQNETINEKPVAETLPGSDVTTGEWVEGKATDNAWVDGKLEEGEADKGTEVTSNPVEIKPEAPERVELNLTPGGTDSESFTVTLEDVATGAYALPTGDDYTVEEIKENGQVIGWTVTRKTVTTAEKPYETIVGETTVTQKGEVKQQVVKPQGYTVGETTENGVTTKVEEILDADGNFLGYKVTKTTVTETDNAKAPVVTGSDRETTTVTTAAPDGFALPEKPQESVATNEYNQTITTTVEDIIENGKHVGYKTISVTTTEDGQVVYTESKSIYGTSSTTSIETKSDPETEETVTTTKVTTTNVEEIYLTESTRDMELVTQRTEKYETTILTEEDTYQLVETEDGGMYFLYQGKMYEVQAIEGHGNTTLKPIQPDKDLITAREGSDLRNKNGTSNGLFDSLSNNSGNPNDYEFRYVGNGLASTLLVNRYNGDSWGNLTNHQFALQDSNGEIHYVYCADIATSAYSGYFYDIQNLTDADYYQGGDSAVDHIRAIALNGFWGTEGGKDTTGSLAAVKQLLIDNGHADVAATLTEGQALTATQAAIWKFGNKDSDRKLADTIVQRTFTDGNINANHVDSKNTQVLYELLISLTDTTSSETDIIDKEDITGATIVVNGEAKDAGGNVKTDESGNKKYDTDISFTLKVDKSSITGNLKVHVYANGDTENPIATKWLAGDGFLQYGIEADENGTYTISDLEIAEGVTITLNLEGTQKLDKGVYIYTSEAIADTTSQTFVGVAEGERKVDLKVDLKFTVEDPEIAYTNTTTTQKRTDTAVDTKTDTRTDTLDTTRTVKTNEQLTETSHNVQVYGTVTVTETKKDTTKEERNWEAYWEYVLQTINDDDGGDEDDGEEILDEEVPLAAAPKTGDISALWAALSLISVGGMVMLARKREET